MLIYRGTPAQPLSPVALTIGNFDGVHIGHRAMLARLTQAARERGLSPCVMTFEPHPREFFTPEQAPARLSNLREKLELFERFGVERVFIMRFNKRFAQVSAEDFIDRILHQGLQARWVLVGDDFRFGRDRSGTWSAFQAAGQDHGFKVNAVTVIKGGRKKIGSSTIRHLINKGKLRAAKRLLGRNVSIMGKVVKGDGRGKRLGFPTANIPIGQELVPPVGVYAVKVRVGSRMFPGMANVGRRPSFRSPHGDVNVEAHLFGFKGTLYHREIIVEFIRKIRDEKMFLSSDKLIVQLQKDKKKVEKILRNEK